MLQVLKFERFAQDQIHARRALAGVVHKIPKPSEENDRRGRVAGLGGARNFIAVGAGHGAVRDHQVKSPGAEFFQGFAAILRRLDRVSIDLQIFFEQFPSRTIVLREQNPQTGGGGVCRGLF